MTDIEEKLEKAKDQSNTDFKEIEKKLIEEKEVMKRLQIEMMRHMQEQIDEGKRERERLELELEEKNKTLEHLMKEVESKERKKEKKNIFGFLAKIVPFGAAVVAALGNF